MKMIKIIFGTFLFFNCPAWGDENPELRDVLENVADGLGGKTSIEALKEISAVAHVVVGDRSYTVITNNKGFDEAKFERIYPDRHVTVSFNNKGVLSKNHRSELIEKAPNGFKYFVLGHQFHWEVFNIQNFKNLKLNGTRNFRGCECLVVSGQTGNDRPIEFLINPNNWGVFGSTLMPEGLDYVIDFVYEDWQMVDGFQVFKTLKIYDADSVFLYSFGSISIE